MKKLFSVAAVLVVGVSIAYASSLSVPWFVDVADTAMGPVPETGIQGIVRLKSNVEDPIVCDIAYYNADGDFLGPDYPHNTFAIAPLSAVAFRPVAIDPAPGITYEGLNAFGQPVTIEGVAGGQEQAQGVLVPVRPRDVDDFVNGSITISWVGGPTDVQGIYTQFGGGWADGMSFGVLLPPGT